MSYLNKIVIFLFKEYFVPTQLYIKYDNMQKLYFIITDHAKVLGRDSGGTRIEIWGGLSQ